MTMHKTLAALAFTLLLTACGADAPASEATSAPATEATATAESADAASQTEAVYGDEAPVAIEAAPVDDHGHAHNADGSHAEGDEHAHGEAGDDHGHDHGDGDHAH
jgi:ABC-type Zn uptake system ZnuABC Zn-binding protein ZnuA